MPLSTYDWEVFVPLIGALSLPKPFLLIYRNWYLMLEPNPALEAFFVLVEPALKEAEF